MKPLLYLLLVFVLPLGAGAQRIDSLNNIIWTPILRLPPDSILNPISRHYVRNCEHNYSLERAEKIAKKEGYKKDARGWASVVTIDTVKHVWIFTSTHKAFTLNPKIYGEKKRIIVISAVNGEIIEKRKFRYSRLRYPTK